MIRFVFFKKWTISVRFDFDQKFFDWTKPNQRGDNTVILLATLICTAYIAVRSRFRFQILTHGLLVSPHVRRHNAVINYSLKSKSIFSQSFLTLTNATPSLLLTSHVVINYSLKLKFIFSQSLLMHANETCCCRLLMSHAIINCSPKRLSSLYHYPSIAISLSPLFCWLSSSLPIVHRAIVYSSITDQTLVRQSPLDHSPILVVT